MFKFIHCADLHIDSALRGLSQKGGAPVDELRLATRRALNNLVEMAIAEPVQFVVIAGDVFDGDWPDYSTGLFFNQCMAELGQSGIRVVMVSGNHDAESQITRHLSLPANVTRLSVQQPQSVVWEDLAVAIHGQGFPQRDVRTNLVPGYPDPKVGYFNIGLLHCSVDGQGGHENYAPCKLDDLIYKGYDYWALGHIHKRQVLHRDPYVVYSGNLQGRHAKETGAKGAMLITVTDAREVTLEFRPLDVVRWELAEVNLTGAEREEEISDRVAQSVDRITSGRLDIPLALRVELVGTTLLHGELLAHQEAWRGEVENLALTRAPGRVWLEEMKVNTRPLPEFTPTLQEDAMAALIQTMKAAEGDPEFLGAFLKDMEPYQRYLGPAYAQREDATRVDSPEDLVSLIHDAQALLLSLLDEGAKRR